MSKAVAVASSDLRLEALKTAVVKSMFIDMADKDYVLARMAHGANMYNVFFWLAGQAIEKYLKASLLLNEKSAKGYSHKLPELFEEVCKYASDLFPKSLGKPDELEIPSGHWLAEDWNEEPPVDFVERFGRYANAHVRYNVFPFVVYERDLFHFDQFAFAARRVAVPLRVVPFKKQPEKTWHHLLKESPGYCTHRTSFKRLLESLPDLTVRDAAQNLNFPLAPSDYPHKAQIGSAMSNPVLIMHVMGSAEGDPDCLEKADLGDWAVKSIELPKTIKHSLRDQVGRLRQQGKRKA